MSYEKVTNNFNICRSTLACNVTAQVAL